MLETKGGWYGSVIRMSFIVIACYLEDAQTAPCRGTLTHKRSHGAVMTFDSDVDSMLQLVTRQSDMPARED